MTDDDLKAKAKRVREIAGEAKNIQFTIEFSMENLEVAKALGKTLEHAAYNNLCLAYSMLGAVHSFLESTGVKIKPVERWFEEMQQADIELLNRRQH